MTVKAYWNEAPINDSCLALRVLWVFRIMPQDDVQQDAGPTDTLYPSSPHSTVVLLSETEDWWRRRWKVREGKKKREERNYILPTARPHPLGSSMLLPKEHHKQNKCSNTWSLRVHSHSHHLKRIFPGVYMACSLSVYSWLLNSYVTLREIPNHLIYNNSKIPKHRCISIFSPISSLSFFITLMTTK